MNPLISTAELDERRTDPSLVLLDASYYLPNESINASAQFALAHIEGGQFLDIDTVSDDRTSLPHMVPSAARFAEAVESLGISTSSSVVVYDQRGLFSAPRVWWLFTVFGHPHVQVLDGGLPKWQREDRPTVSGATPTRPRGAFTARGNRALIRDRAEIEANVHTKSETLLDARAAGRFAGTVAEPRPGVRSGHVPGAVSVPFSSLLQADGTMLPKAALNAHFIAMGLERDRPLVTMCGSGITAAVITIGLVRAGWPIGSLYDGSWAEWGSATDTPIESAP